MNPPAPWDVFLTGGTTVSCASATGAALPQVAAIFTVVDYNPPTIACPAHVMPDCSGLPLHPVGSEICYNTTTSCVIHTQLNADGSVNPAGDTNWTLFAVSATTSYRYTCTVNVFGRSPTDPNHPGTDINVASCDGTVDPAPAPPVIRESHPTIVLWPPNHKYHTVSLNDCGAVAWDNCTSPPTKIDLPTFGKIVAVQSDEAVIGTALGAGNTCSDIIIVDNITVQVRSERQGTSNGRVYTVFFQVADPHRPAEMATGACKIAVPHDRSGAAAVDDKCAAGGYCVDLTSGGTCSTTSAGCSPSPGYACH